MIRDFDLLQAGASVESILANGLKPIGQHYTFQHTASSESIIRNFGHILGENDISGTPEGV